MTTLRAWLEEGPFALAMSSGFFGFFAHAGFVSVLEEEGLCPVRVAGSSAGALVGAAWASGLGAAALADELLSLSRPDFWDPSPGPGLLRGGLFRRRLEALLPVSTFEACPTPFGVSVFDVLARRTRVIDRGPLVPAVQASCAVPLMFHPVWIEGRPLLDGGLLDRPGLSSLPEGTRVLYHHLASRSPWRRRSSPALALPVRPGLASVAFDGLPRVGPFRMAEGRRAFEASRRAARLALDRAPEGGVVRFHAP